MPGEPALQTTPLHAMHVSLGARLVPFAGYEMPVQFPAGIMKEHLHTREAAGLFDVGHMGQIAVTARDGNLATAALALERLIPADILGLSVGRQRYGLLLGADGGILDDLMVANRGDTLHLVVNAATKGADFAHLQEHLGESCTVDWHRPSGEDAALLALQGPAAGALLAALAPETQDMRFMDVGEATLAGVSCLFSRSGYTGEDGFEISMPASAATTLAQALLADERVQPIGLGARDSLRLEAGLCLYGHDIDPKTTPVEAALTWAIPKVRRRGGDRAGGFPGGDAVLDQLQNGPTRLRTGLRPDGRAPMREGTPLFADQDAADPIGGITSGGFGPSVGAPISIGYLPAELAKPGTQVFGEVRGKRLPATTCALPFVTPRYKRR